MTLFYFTFDSIWSYSFNSFYLLWTKFPRLTIWNLLLTIFLILDLCSTGKAAYYLLMILGIAYGGTCLIRFAQFIIISWTLLKNWRWSRVLVRIIVTVLLYLICKFIARQLINFLTLNLLTLLFRFGHMLNIVDLIFLFKPRWIHLITLWGS